MEFDCERLNDTKLNSDVTTLVALFAIVSPITSIPVFLSLTSGATREKRRVIALQTALVSGLTLFIAYFVGDVILKLLSIQMDAFRIAGALIIGEQGLMVLTRIFDLLLLAIAVSTIMSALTSAFPGLRRQRGMSPFTSFNRRVAL